MFPDPTEALPLPQRPNLERYKKLAKDLVKACKSDDKSDDKNAVSAWAEKWVMAVAKQSGIQFTRELHATVSRWIDKVERFVLRTIAKSDGRCRMADAQFIIARSHGFDSWPRFSKHLNGLTQKNSAVARFEAAADAIIKGDLKTLQRLLRDDPKLVHARSTREHGATLLHYV